MKYKIKFFSDFASPQRLKEIYEKLYDVHKMPNYGIDKDIYITANNDYTHVIILNFIKPEDINNIKINKSNVVAIAQEPPMFITHSMRQNLWDYLVNHVGKYFIGDTIFTEPFVEKYSYLLHNKPLDYIPFKTKRMSFIVSEKKDYWFGYGYRYKLLSYILTSYLPIDIYGRSSRVCKEYNIQDARIKGEFTMNEPYIDYEFHICIENFITNAYVSEKVINPLLTNTVPIYLGCKNIKQYFGDNVIQLNGDIIHDMNLIVDVLNYPEKYRRNIDIEMVKKRINILENLDDVFS
jgi:hypothetical protein